MAFERVSPRSHMIRCTDCGARGYPEGNWVRMCEAGHAPCPGCGRLLTLSARGNPRHHPGCLALATAQRREPMPGQGTLW